MPSKNIVLSPNTFFLQTLTTMIKYVINIEVDFHYKKIDFMTLETIK